MRFLVMFVTAVCVLFLIKILDMVEHCHLEFTENPYQQYPKPPIKFNSEEAAIIDGEIQQLLGKGVLEETDPTYGQYVSTILIP